MSDYSKTQPFRFWCQKVLPLVYDDSLSYYELLCKVVDKLNKVIETDNGLVDEMNKLKEAYNTLKEYIDNYFTNLDVQNEINNKIDALIASNSFFNKIPYILTVVDNSDAIKSTNLSKDTNIFERENNIFSAYPSSSIFRITDKEPDWIDGYTSIKLKNGLYAVMKNYIPYINCNGGSTNPRISKPLFDVAYSYFGKNIEYLHTASSVFGTPERNDNGSWGMTCSQFAMALVCGLSYDNSKFAGSTNKYLNGFYYDDFLIDKLADTSNEWWSHQIAPYALSKGFAFYASSINECQCGDILCYNLGNTDDENRFMKIEHTAVYTGLSTDTIYNVFEVRDDVGPRNGWYQRSYFKQCVLVLRFPNSCNNETNVIASDNNSLVTTNSTLKRVLLGENVLKANKVYTLVCRCEFDDDKNMYLGIYKDDNTLISNSPNNFNSGPVNSIYTITFRPTEDIKTAFKIITVHKSGTASQKATYFWCDLFEGAEINIDEYVHKEKTLIYRNVKINAPSTSGGYSTVNADFDGEFVALRYFDITSGSINKCSVSGSKIYINYTNNVDGTINISYLSYL